MAGGRGLGEFRAEFLGDRRIRTLVDYESAKDVFPTVGIGGGICYFLWDRDNPGLCECVYHRNGVTIGPHARALDEFDVFVRDKRAVDILHKVVAANERPFEELVSGDTPFGLATNFADYAQDVAPKRGQVRLRRVLDNPEAMAAVERIEGWRALGDNIIETIINKSEKVKELKNKAKDGDLTAKQKKQLTEEEKEYKSKRKLVQEKLIKFATRIPAFMYLTDFRENTLQDVITKLEPELFLAVTGLTVKDFYLLVRLKVFNTEYMNQAVFAFRRYEDASLRYTGIESHEGLTHYGLYDTVVARD